MKKSLKLRIILMGVFLLFCALTASKGVGDASDNPRQELVIGDGWSITGQRGPRRGLFDQCEGTDELIFFCYGGSDLIDAYDLSGGYRFTIDLPDASNGGALINCVDDVLVVRPALGREVLLFRGTELVARMDVETAREQGYKATSFDNESRYAITRTHVVRVDGEELTELFELPEEMRKNLPILTFTPEQNAVLKKVFLVLFALAWLLFTGYCLHGIFGKPAKKR